MPEQEVTHKEVRMYDSQGKESFEPIKTSVNALLTNMQIGGGVLLFAPLSECDGVLLFAPPEPIENLVKPPKPAISLQALDSTRNINVPNLALVPPSIC
jgi:hypothetical protein